MDKLATCISVRLDTFLVSARAMCTFSKFELKCTSLLGTNVERNKLKKEIVAMNHRYVATQAQAA